MATQLFNKNLFTKIMSFIIAVSFILGSVPLRAYAEVFLSANALRASATSETAVKEELRDDLQKTTGKEKLSERLVVRFDEILKEDVPIAGGKGANLGELQHVKGISVPPGVAVTTKAFRAHIDKGLVNVENSHKVTLREFIERRLKKLETVEGGYDNSEALAVAGEDIRAAVRLAQMPAEVKEEITKWYETMCKEAGVKDLPVAVRSSATAEDMADASFAGQQDTYLNMRGIEQVLDAVRRDWASLFTDRAIFYRHEQNIDHGTAYLSAVIQRMIRSKIAGTGFSVEMTSGFRAIRIDGAWGLGEGVVSGTANPDSWIVVKDKSGRFRILRREFGAKLQKVVYKADGAAVSKEGTELADTNYTERHSFSLTDSQVLELARAIDAIQQHYGRYMDVEWGFDDNGKLWILQARSETIWNQWEKEHPGVTKIENLVVPDDIAAKAKNLLPRSIAGSKAASGKVVIVDGTKEGVELAKDLARVKKGNILVTTMTKPDMVPAMKRAGAIVTDQGGPTCHAAIIARELGIPCVVGTAKATQVLKEGVVITVDANRAMVYEGAVKIEKIAKNINVPNLPVTKTKIGIIAASPALAMAVWGLSEYPSHYGVSLLRKEVVDATEIRVHPLAGLAYDKYLQGKITNGKERQWVKENIMDNAELSDHIGRIVNGYKDYADFFKDKLANAIALIAATQSKGQRVKFRTTDFKTNEYRDQIGGSLFEPKEKNPMMGYRGIYRMLAPSYKEAFELELEAIRIARLQQTNIDVMFPVVRTVEEMEEAADLMAKHGLFEGDDPCQLGIMVEVAANVTMADEFFSKLAQLAKKYHTKAFMSIGSNDLTQFTLGLGRDNEKMKPFYDENNPAVRKAIEIVIKTARKYGITTGLCGQRPSNDANFAGFLQQCGIDSIGVVPEVYDNVIKVVAKQEKEMGDTPFNPNISGYVIPEKVGNPVRINAKEVKAASIIAERLNIHPVKLLEYYQGRLRGSTNLSDIHIVSQIEEELAGMNAKDFVINAVVNQLGIETKGLSKDALVIYSTDDLDKDSYEQMIGGRIIEVFDENPQLGFCGLARVIDPAYEEFFRWQLAAIKEAKKDLGIRNIGIKLNLVRTLDEVKRALAIMKEEGIVPGQDGFMVGIEMGTPANVLLVDDFIKTGINFISENNERFLDYDLALDPASKDVHYSDEIMQKALDVPRRIWTTAAEKNNIPMVQFEGGVSPATTPIEPTRTIIISPTGAEMPFSPSSQVVPLITPLTPPAVDPLVLSNIVSLLEGAQTGGSNIEHAFLDGANGGIFNHSERRGRLEIAMENMLKGLGNIINNGAPYEARKNQWIRTLKTENLSDKDIETSLIWLTDFENGTYGTEHLSRTLVNYIMNVQLRKVIAYADKHPIVQTVLCVGETKEQRQAGKTQEVLKQDLTEILAGISKEQAQKIGLRIAYEPRWAINQKPAVTPDPATEIEPTHRFIKNTLAGIMKAELEVDYGGSLNKTNCATILALPDVDGGLIGGAAKKAEEIAPVIDEAIKQGGIKGKVLNIGMNWKAENTSTGLAPLDDFVKLFLTKDLSKVHIAIGTPNVKLVRDTMTKLENEINAQIKKNMPRTKVAINGFGRIGKLVLKAYLEHPDNNFEIVAVNDLDPITSLAHLFKHDSTLGGFNGEVKVEGDTLIINGNRIKVLSKKDPAELPWKDLGVEVVIESTGRFTKKEDASKHIQAGAKKVVITAPGEKEDITVVLGVNEEKYDPAKHQVISNASCTTNCLAPVAKVLNDKFGIEIANMVTVHAVTNDQVVLDGPHKDARRGRNIFNMIPTKTGAAKAVGLVLPELQGKINGFAIRVPTADVSVVKLTALLKTNTTKEEVNAALEEAAKSARLGRYLGYTKEELVSSDFLHNDKSSIVDASLTDVTGGKLVTVVAWYDNEWGYSNRTVDLVNYMLGKEKELAKGATTTEVKMVKPAAAPELYKDVPWLVNHKADLKDKKVVSRVDWNISGKSIIRIRASIPGILYVLENGGTPIIATHYGRPGGKVDPQYSVKPLADILKKLLAEQGKSDIQVNFLDGSVTEKGLQEGVKSRIIPGAINILENTRFCPGDEKNDPAFAQALAGLGDVFNFAGFGAGERVHASTAGLAEYMGQIVLDPLTVTEEQQIRSMLDSLYGVIFGGGPKVSEKINTLTSIINNIKEGGYVIIGTGPLPAFLKAMYNIEIGQKAEEADVTAAKAIIALAGKKNVKILLPQDFVAADTDLSVKADGKKSWLELKKMPSYANTFNVTLDQLKRGPSPLPFIYDIGPQSISELKQILSSTPKDNTIFWNGTVGVNEMSAFEAGTKELALTLGAISKNKTRSEGVNGVTGGGDTAAAMEQFGVDQQLTFVSTGGGASLALLEGKELTAITRLAQLQATRNTLAKKFNIATDDYVGYANDDATVNNAQGGAAFSAFTDDVLKYLQGLSPEALKAIKTQAIIIDPGFFKAGGLKSTIGAAAKLSKFVRIALYGENAEKIKALIGNKDIVSAKDVTTVYSDLSRLGITSTIILRSKDELPKDVETILSASGDMQIISSQLPALAIAKALRELFNDNKVDGAFEKFLNQVKADNIVSEDVYNDNRAALLAKMEKGKVFEFSADLMPAPEITGKTEVEAARRQSEEFLVKIGV